MGKTAIYLHTVVRPGGRIEIAAPAGLREGDGLDLVLLTEKPAPAQVSRSVLEILNSLPPDCGMFKSAQDVDAYIRGERESWEH